MDSQVIKALAQELAKRVNGAVDVPLIKEEDEQAFFELIILIILELVFNKLGFKYELAE